MKRILFILLLFIFFIIGCENTLNTPTSRVETLFSKYQKLDKDVLNELDSILEKNNNMTKEEKKEYKELMIKQYQNLSYKIKNEEISNNKAFVEVEIEVLDYKTALINAEKMYKEEKNECKELVDCKISKLKQVNEKTKKELLITTIKQEGIWGIIELSDDDIKKIHGLL